MIVNHLHLQVRSVERAQAFYERFFGLTPFVRHGDILFLRDQAGMDLALAPVPDPPEAPQWFHFGFRLETPEAVERLHATVSEAGVTLREPLIREEGLVHFRCLDPDGYGIEVYWEPQPL